MESRMALKNYSTGLRKKGRSHYNKKRAIKSLYEGGGSKEKIRKAREVFS